MKVLKLSLPLFLAYSFSLSANENSRGLDAYISDLKQEQFKYDYQKNEADSSILRDSWIAPLKLNYSYVKSKPYVDELINQNAAIRMDQAIFQSGGILYGIKFASASKLYSDYTVDVAKRKMIKDAVSILMQIKQTDLKEKAQKLQIINSEINLEQKTEQYLSGQLDSGFLDDAVIQMNLVIQVLFDIQTAKEKLINKFSTLSDLSYENANIPNLALISIDEFLEHNIVLKQNAAEIEKNEYYKNVTIAKYLPKVSIIAGYNWSNSEQQFDSNLVPFKNNLSYYDYGVKASIPLDINSFRDIESIKIDYLKAQVVQKDKERELKALFSQVLHNIDNFDNKIKLSNESMGIYKKLLDDTKELFLAGYKTQYDVDTLNNSLKIQKIDSRVFEIDKQLELLTLYEMYVNNGE
ncbi:MAG TPA: transporter [Sulfurimonas sp.]|nr:transporter [Sulfurimonas sp.]HIM74997.1 transporter [Campylobacterales bacterium]